MRHFQHLLLLSALVLLPVFGGKASEAITLTVNPQQQGAPLSEDTLGLSYETSLLLPDEKGVHYFRPDNRPLVAMFKTLGIKSLRIGGNAVDTASIATPSDQDVSSLFEFAKAAGVKVIYSVRLKAGDPAAAAKVAKLVHDHYRDELDCFAIGNEPRYYKIYDVYRTKWKAIKDAMLAVYPEARFGGADQNPDPELIKKMVQDFGPAGHFTLVTEHSYPFGCSYRNPRDRNNIANLVSFDPIHSCERMLDPSAYPIYEKLQQGLADAVAGTSIPFRLSETNSYWCSGLKGASDRYASALWALDYLHWWASHGAKGLNFHTGDKTGGDQSMVCRYAAFVTSDSGYEARPLSYGIKLFDLGGHGRQIPLTITSPAGMNIAAYANLAEDHTLFVTVINKSHGADVKPGDLVLNINPPSTVTHAEAIFLRAASSDIAAESGITLGDATIAKDGNWNGKWTPLPVSTPTATLTTTLPPLTAVVIKANLQ